jgi:hypothetical protein
MVSSRRSATLSSGTPSCSIPSTTSPRFGETDNSVDAIPGGARSCTLDARAASASRKGSAVPTSTVHFNLVAGDTVGTLRNLAGPRPGQIPAFWDTAHSAAKGHPQRSRLEHPRNAKSCEPEGPQDGSYRACCFVAGPVSCGRAVVELGCVGGRSENQSASRINRGPHERAPPSVPPLLLGRGVVSALTDGVALRTEKGGPTWQQRATVARRCGVALRGPVAFPGPQPMRIGVCPSATQVRSAARKGRLQAWERAKTLRSARPGGPCRGRGWCG